MPPFHELRYLDGRKSDAAAYRSLEPRAARLGLLQRGQGRGDRGRTGNGGARRNESARRAMVRLERQKHAPTSERRSECKRFRRDKARHDGVVRRRSKPLLFGIRQSDALAAAAQLPRARGGSAGHIPRIPPHQSAFRRGAAADAGAERSCLGARLSSVPCRLRTAPIGLARQSGLLSACAFSVGGHFRHTAVGARYAGGAAALRPCGGSRRALSTQPGGLYGL